LEALDRVGLSALSEERATRLTHGQRKMVELARAVVSRPRLILLDEPASGLHDAEVAGAVEAIATFTAGGGGVLMVEHHMGLVRRVSYDVVVLDFGEVIAHGTPDVVAADPNVVAAYLGNEQL
jgi:ABC-type branched-subunit amino acid transport system ATPase component